MLWGLGIRAHVAGTCAAGTEQPRGPHASRLRTRSAVWLCWARRMAGHAADIHRKSTITPGHRRAASQEERGSCCAQLRDADGLGRKGAHGAAGLSAQWSDSCLPCWTSSWAAVLIRRLWAFSLTTRLEPSRPTSGSAPSRPDLEKEDRPSL